MNGKIPLEKGKVSIRRGRARTQICERAKRHRNPKRGGGGGYEIAPLAKGSG